MLLNGISYFSPKVFDDIFMPDAKRFQSTMLSARKDCLLVFSQQQRLGFYSITPFMNLLEIFDDFLIRKTKKF